jgi:hypothetical protein
MSKSASFDLINGTFSAEDAQEMLNHFFSERSRYFVSRQYTIYERFGEECQLSKRRLNELSIDKQKIMEAMKLAQLSGKRIEISSDIRIRLVDERMASANKKQVLPT